MSVQDELLLKMIEYSSGDPKRIQHFIKVHSFAKMIGALEGLHSNTHILLANIYYLISIA